MKKLILILLLLYSCTLNISCVGATANIKAERLEHPVSLSEGVYNDRFKLLDSDQYEVLEEFSFTVRKWGIFWSALTLGKNEDISDRLNKLIRKNRGDAIVDLTFSTQNSDVNFVLMYLSVAAIGGAIIYASQSDGLETRFDPVPPAIAAGASLFVPGAVDAIVEGKVVKFLDQATATQFKRN